MSFTCCICSNPIPPSKDSWNPYHDAIRIGSRWHICSPGCLTLFLEHRPDLQISDGYTEGEPFIDHARLAHHPNR